MQVFKTLPRLLALLIILGIDVADGALAAEEDGGSNLQRGTFANPLKRDAPRYPNRELKAGRQGWVRLGYVVTENGTVIDPVIEDSSGSRAFEDAALRVVRKWKFEPATWDGKPVEQCHAETMINFVFSGQEMIVSNGFASRYRRINKNISQGAYSDAQAIIDETFAQKHLNVYEVARLWILDGNLAQAMQDDERQLSSLRRATANNGSWLEKDVYAAVLRAIVTNELKLGAYSAAIRNYEKLLALGIDKNELESIPQIMDTLDTAISGNEIIATPAKIQAGRQCDDCVADWQYRPLRRNFRIANVNGALGDLEIRCDWKRVKDVAREGMQWQLPEEWGSCNVIVFGDQGTSFSMLEEPDRA